QQHKPGGSAQKLAAGDTNVIQRVHDNLFRYAWFDGLKSVCKLHDCSGRSGKSLFQVRHESSCTRPYSIDRGSGRDVERAVVVVPPSQIRWLFRQNNSAEMIACRVPDPNALWTGHKKISIAVDFDSVGNPVVFATRFFAENVAGAQSHAWTDIVHANISLLAVIHVEVFAVGREAETVRLRQILCK